MPVPRYLIAILLLGLTAVPAMAADPPMRGCLTKAEQRAEVDAKKAVPLAQAIKTLRDKGHRSEVVRARLCRRGDGLVYVLTLLAGSGKVNTASVDAANGELINTP